MASGHLDQYFLLRYFGQFFASHIKFWIMSFISLMASGGVSIILEAYIKGDSARVLTIVIFPLIDSDRCFQILSKFLRLSSWLLVIYIPRVSRGVFIQDRP